ncbi:hypothetical protein ACFX2A_014542 [Malus domestica]
MSDGWPFGVLVVDFWRRAEASCSAVGGGRRVIELVDHVLKQALADGQSFLQAGVVDPVHDLIYDQRVRTRSLTRPIHHLRQVRTPPDLPASAQCRSEQDQCPAIRLGRPATLG